MVLLPNLYTNQHVLPLSSNSIHPHCGRYRLNAGRDSCIRSWRSKKKPWARCPRFHIYGRGLRVPTASTSAFDVFLHHVLSLWHMGTLLPGAAPPNCAKVYPCTIRVPTSVVTATPRSRAQAKPTPLGMGVAAIMLCRASLIITV